MKIKETTEIEPARPMRATTGSRPAQAVDRVSVESAEEVRAAISAARNATQGTRSARLREVEAAIKAGHYKPDPQQIAQRIVDAAELEAKIQVALSTPP